MAATKKRTKPARRKVTSKRELTDTGNQKRYVRRNSEGQFHEIDDVGRSLSQDRRRKAKTVVKAGQAEKGDQKGSTIFFFAGLVDWRSFHSTTG